jgi:uncharacterized protein YdiU (UPF0061 family)
MKFGFDNTYATFPERFYARVSPTAVRAPRLIAVNDALARTLGLDSHRLSSDEGASIFAGNTLPEDAEPIALAYAGHQFGSFVRQLGDGRAILLGEIIADDGRRVDLQLKGAGRTPFSRGGDGRAALGPVLREWLVSEAMHALGVPTTRALAAVTTGEPVYRDRVLKGAVFTRVASSHLRVGTFEYFAARGDEEALDLLVRYALRRHYGDVAFTTTASAARALLEHVADTQAELVARWLGLGFVHGVMNTDNTSIAGETLDYGPCAFLDTYAPFRCFSSIDRGGRYAFMNQPKMAQLNLARLAEALLARLADEEGEAISVAESVLQRYAERFERAYVRVLRAKLGLFTEDARDAELARDLFVRMAEHKVDFTLFFRRLASAARAPSEDVRVAELFEAPTAFHEWASRWRARLTQDAATAEERSLAMRRVNPAIIPRNHRVEEAISAAEERDDFGPFRTLTEALARPYDEPSKAHVRFTEAPGEEQAAYRTFCGT